VKTDRPFGVNEDWLEFTVFMLFAAAVIGIPVFAGAVGLYRLATWLL
jgi:hypothetical protein